PFTGIEQNAAPAEAAGAGCRASVDDAGLRGVTVPAALHCFEACRLAGRQVLLLEGVARQIEQLPAALVLRQALVPDDLPVTLAHGARTALLPAHDILV